MGLKVVGILLEGEKYELATKLFQTGLRAAPIELQHEERASEKGDLEGESVARGLLRLFTPPFLSLCSLKN